MQVAAIHAMNRRSGHSACSGFLGLQSGRSDSGVFHPCPRMLVDVLAFDNDKRPIESLQGPDYAPYARGDPAGRAVICFPNTNRQCYVFAGLCWLSQHPLAKQSFPCLCNITNTTQSLFSPLLGRKRLLSPQHACVC